MTVLLILAGVAFTTFMLYLMVKPLAVSREDAVRVDHLAEQFREIELLMARRGVLLSSLRELEFERETDKIAKADYERFRARYEREAVTIMKRLDELHGGRGWEARIDEELTELLGRAPHIVTLKQRAADGADDSVVPVSDDSHHEEAAEPTQVPLEEVVAHVSGDAEDASQASEEAEDEADQDPEEVPEELPAKESSDESNDAVEKSAADERDDETTEQASDGKAGDDATCIECGADLEADDKFCSQCGTPVSSDRAVATEATA